MSEETRPEYDYFDENHRLEPVDPSYQFDEYPTERNILRQTEWDFPKYLEDPKISKNIITRLEGRACLEYELTREIYYANESYKDSVFNKAKNGNKKFREEHFRLKNEKRKDPIDILKNEFPFEYQCHLYASLHPYIDCDSFPHVPWFSLGLMQKELYLTSFIRDELGSLPEEFKVTIDIRWSTEDIKSYIKYFKDRFSSTINTNVMKQVKKGSMIYNPPELKENQGGRDKGVFIDTLIKLGRYRIVSHYKSAKGARDFWLDHKDTSIPRSRKYFGIKELNNWHKETLDSYIENSPFLTKCIRGGS